MTGKTRKQDGEHDRRGGIVWHTQGSGKSLTMVFLVRKLRSVPELRRFKVVIVTDRKDLQDQLSATAELVGEKVQVAASVAAVKRLLRKPGPEIVFATIQKYIDRDLDALGDLGLLNEDEAILVLVDEAHRSHSSALHASLLQPLPNCARIGFTGTPILMGDKRTHEIFGEFIDRYTIRQSEADGATVPILYEGRFAKGALADGAGLDEELATLLPGMSAEEREALRRKYGTLGAILEATELVAAKSRDILRHYVENVLPSGLKAQVVAFSRRAAVRYQEYVDGEGFSYLGRGHRLLLVDRQEAPVKLEQGRFKMRRDAVGRGREHMIRWYGERAQAWLASRVDRFRKRIGVEPASVQVQDLGYRWGSCGKGGNLYFHWRTILLPPRIAEYVVVHELAHLLEPHHTPAFWSRVERALPDFAIRKQWLAEHGREASAV